MDQLRILFEYGAVSRESIDSTLKAYNDSCAEVRSEARDAFIGGMMKIIESMNNTFISLRYFASIRLFYCCLFSSTRSNLRTTGLTTF